MKRIFLSFSVIVLSFALFSQSYTPTDEGSKVHFSINNFGIATGGNFKGLSGSIKFDPANLAASDFDVSVDANSIDTDIEARDNHLRKAEYFDVAAYPKLSFKSTRLTKTNRDGYFYLFGTIRSKESLKKLNSLLLPRLKTGVIFLRETLN